jgi:hypothetical protein
MKKSRLTTPKKTLNKKEIKAALVETLCPAGVAPKTTAQRIVSEWSKWKMSDEWIKQNPDEGGKIVTCDDQGNQKTALEEHHAKFNELKEEMSGLFLIALLGDDATIFRGIAAAISKQKRVESKLKDGIKPFD